MANHVYNYISVDGNDAVLDQFEKLGENFTTEREIKNWEGNPMKITEFKPLEELDFMPEYDEEDWYNWYCNNVGAKWCNIEEWEGSYMNLGCAWSPCREFVEKLTIHLAKTDPNVQVRHQYEDEFRNFIGVVVFEGVDGADILFEELDDAELTELFKEESPEFDLEVEEWTDEAYQAYDDFVYNWFESQTL
jgi:hypothetical protein